jgi:hypothetical protein
VTLYLHSRHWACQNSQWSVRRTLNVLAKVYRRSGVENHEGERTRVDMARPPFCLLFFFFLLYLFITSYRFGERATKQSPHLQFTGRIERFHAASVRCLKPTATPLIAACPFRNVLESLRIRLDSSIPLVLFKFRTFGIDLAVPCRQPDPRMLFLPKRHHGPLTHILFIAHRYTDLHQGREK